MQAQILVDRFFRSALAHELKLTVYELAILVTLASYMGTKDSYRVAISQIAHDSFVSISKLKRSLKILKDKKLLNISGVERSTSVYSLGEVIHSLVSNRYQNGKAEKAPGVPQTPAGVSQTPDLVSHRPTNNKENKINNKYLKTKDKEKEKEKEMTLAQKISTGVTGVSVTEAPLDDVLAQKDFVDDAWVDATNFGENDVTPTEEEKKQRDVWLAMSEAEMVGLAKTAPLVWVDAQKCRSEEASRKLLGPVVGKASAKAFGKVNGKVNGKAKRKPIAKPRAWQGWLD